MKRRYGTALRKAAEEIIPRRLPGFCRTKDLTFSSGFFTPRETIFLRRRPERSTLLLAISPDEKHPTRFTAYVGWIQSLVQMVPTQGAEAVQVSSDGIITPRPEVLSGVLGLEMLERAQFQLGYTIPSSYDEADRKLDAYVKSHGVRAMMSKEYADYYAQCQGDADAEDEELNSDAIKAACVSALEHVVEKIGLVGVPFWDRLD